MVNESAGPTKRTWLGCTVMATADRLVIRMPIGHYGIVGLFVLVSLLLPWVMVEVGLVDGANLTEVTLMMAAGLVFFVALLGRWWTLDRTTDSVRYFPWRLCALSAIRGVRVVERRVGKRNLEIAYTVDLDLEGRTQVRFAGFFYSQLGPPEALALATMIAEWLNVPVTEEHLSPASFAATVPLPGDANDPNAAFWPTAQPEGSLDGEWAGRWSGGSAADQWAVGTATIQTVGERVYILFRQGDGAFLIDARLEGGNRLVGKYLNLQDHRDTYPWVGLIVNDERID